MFGKKKIIENPSKNSPIRETNEEAAAPKKSIKVPSIKLGSFRNISSIIDGRVFSSELITRNVPFIFFLIFLAMLYIANNYRVQAKVRKIDTITRELKDLRDEHISIKSNLMFRTKKSEVANQLKDKGIKEATKPPYKIYIKKEDLK